VFDGRLDNRDTLAVRLTGRDRSLDTPPASDAELVLRAYDAWGADCATRLLGDFAFCIWDEQRQALTCGRDHFGVKPLYYARKGSTLVVSSALRGVRRHPAVTPRLNDAAIGDFLVFGLSVEPDQTPFADVARLPAAHRLTAGHSSTVVARYWNLPPADLIRYDDPRDYVEQFATLLRVAVADRVRTDRVGLLLSGGLDSSSIAAMAAASVPDGAAASRLRAFTVVYDTLMRDEEPRFSALVARSLGIEQVQMPGDDYQPYQRWESDALPPEPSLEALTAVMGDLLDRASAHGPVVLTGEGGDPMLLPSSLTAQLGRVPLRHLVRDLWRSRRLGIVPPLGIRSRLTRSMDPLDAVPEWLAQPLLATFDPRSRSREVWSRRLANRGPRADAVNDATDGWWTSTFEGLDPGATGRPVEVRYPYFDVRLASFALRLPSFPWCLDKAITRSAMRGRLPEQVRLRPKSPLAGDPVGANGRWSAARALALLEATPETRKYVNVEKFRQQVSGDSLLNGAVPGTWAAISLAQWLRHGGAGMPQVSA
jgi:asparagine synthase (glutamine-hydrolysing)